MTDSAQLNDRRGVLYEALLRRNRLVRILRIGVPAIGAIVLLGLVLQLTLASLLGQFGISNISIDRDNLVVETPSYSSMTADGTMFTVQSRAARTSLGDSDLLHLEGAALSVTKPNGSTMQAAASSAEMRLSTQAVSVPGIMEIADSKGTKGAIRAVSIDLTQESLESEGRATIRYHNGTTIDAETMTYRGKERLWVFHNATLTVPESNDPAHKEPAQ